MSSKPSEFEAQLISAGDANSTGTVGSRSCGTFPFRVKRGAVMVTTALSGTSLVVTFTKRVTPGTATGGSTLGTITMATGLAAGTLYYHDFTDLADSTRLIEYGDQVYAAVTTAIGTSGNIDVLVSCEEVPEHIAASTAVTLVTS